MKPPGQLVLDVIATLPDGRLLTRDAQGICHFVRPAPDYDGSKTYPELSSRQRAIIAAIRDLTDKLGYPPSFREVGEEVGINSSSVAYQMGVLKDGGYVGYERYRPRSLKVL